MMISLGFRSLRRVRRHVWRLGARLALWVLGPIIASFETLAWLLVFVGVDIDLANTIVDGLFRLLCGSFGVFLIYVGLTAEVGQAGFAATPIVVHLQLNYSLMSLSWAFAQAFGLAILSPGMIGHLGLGFCLRIFARFPRALIGWFTLSLAWHLLRAPESDLASSSDDEDA